MKKTLIRRGDIYWVDFDPSKATEVKKNRPALVCSHDVLNENSTRIIVAPITSNIRRVYSFEYVLQNKNVEGKIMLDQMRCIDKSRLGKKIDSLSISEMQEIDPILKFVLGLQ